MDISFWSLKMSPQTNLVFTVHILNTLYKDNNRFLGSRETKKTVSPAKKSSVDITNLSVLKDTVLGEIDYSGISTIFTCITNVQKYRFRIHWRTTGVS